MYELAHIFFHAQLYEPLWLSHIDVLLRKTVEICSDEVNPPEFEIEFGGDHCGYSD